MFFIFHQLTHFASMKVHLLLKNTIGLCGENSNNRINSDSPPRRSFVANATSLTPLRPAGYAKR